MRSRITVAAALAVLTVLVAVLWAMTRDVPATVPVVVAAPSAAPQSAAGGFFKGLMVNPFAKGQPKVVEQPQPKAENPRVKVKKGKGGDGDDLAAGVHSRRDVLHARDIPHRRPGSCA